MNPMEKSSLYDRLGLPRDASPEEIRHAYRQLVLRLHPDKNVSKGETELFIDIQKAYEHLSDPSRKANYDKQFPEDPFLTSPLIILTSYSQPSLIRLDEPQLIYSLLELNLHPVTNQLVSSAPLNISLVVDCSTSMQGIRLDTVKLTAIDLVRELQPNDIFSLVKFNDRADLLIPAGSLSDEKSTEMKIQLLQAGGGTEIFKGLEMGFSQVNQHLSINRVNHIILITDGRTYGDEANCDQLADESAALGISISAIGIGNQWNDKFLDQITSKTGGICKYVSDSSDIRTSILGELSRLGSNLTDQITFNYQTSEDVELRSAFRLEPDSSPLVLGPPLVFGFMPKYGAMNILLEFMIKDIPSKVKDFTLAKGFINYEIPRHTIKTKYIQRLIFERKITSEPIREGPPTKILNAMTLLNFYYMQERAREDMAKGNIISATRHMEKLASHLLRKGEDDLAQTVLEEVAYINQNQSYSEDGEKRLKYGTRSLLLPAGTEER
jgi:Ca-activated chloride channel family protein